MDCPDPSKNNNGSSSDSALNNNKNSPESLEEESSYFRYVSSLSPINIKASHGTRSFIGLNSPPLVFKSPSISHRQRQFMQSTQESQSENGEAPGYYWKSNFHQPLLETFIIDTRKVFDANIDANTQHYEDNLSMYKYLADPGDIDQMYFADEDVEQQSTVAAETSLSYPTQSNILNTGTKDGLGDKESLPLSEDSSQVHQQIPVYSDVEKRYSHDPLLPQAAMKYHEVGRRRLQFEEGASSAIGSNNSHEKLNATSNNVKRIELVESVTSTVYPQQGCGNLPLPHNSPGMNMKRSIPSSNVSGELSVEARIDSHELDATGAGNPEELNKSPSPGKKKKKTSVPANQGGCRRCNCKKSKCIKLYCECFNAGTYCVGTCGCEDCLNRPQYEGIILECRRQIESRNQEHSARHKRGCKCKRSTCLKKYCECYQAKVGCSSGCGCQGCKNSYGKKEDYVSSQHSSSTAMVASETDYDLRPLIPTAPPLQCSENADTRSFPMV